MKRAGAITVILTLLVAAFCVTSYAGDIDKKVAALEQQSKQVKKQIRQVNRLNNSRVKQQISAVNQSVRNLMQQRMQVNSQITTMQQQIRTYQQQALQKLNQQIKQYNAEVAKLKNQVSSMPAAKTIPQPAPAAK